MAESTGQPGRAAWFPEGNAEPFRSPGPRAGGCGQTRMRTALQSPCFWVASASASPALDGGDTSSCPCQMHSPD